MPRITASPDRFVETWSFDATTTEEARSIAVIWGVYVRRHEDRNWSFLWASRCEGDMGGSVSAAFMRSERAGRGRVPAPARRRVSVEGLFIPPATSNPESPTCHTETPSR